MSETSRAVNRFFALSTREEVDGVLGNAVFSERIMKTFLLDSLLVMVMRSAEHSLQNYFLKLVLNTGMAMR